jgi:hypothetical protein
MRAPFPATGLALPLALAVAVTGWVFVACTTHEIANTDGQYDNGDDDGGGASSDLPACSFSTNLPDGGTASVAFGRTFLECDEGTASEACLSDDPTTCPDHGSSVPGGTTISCSDQCAPDQYAISVQLTVMNGPDGSVLVSPSPTLPASCEEAVSNPAGTAFYCCDCP